MNCCHSKKNELPLLVLIGLAVHSQTHEKETIEKFYSNGLCISYDRVIEIENNISKDLCQKNKEAEIVCPPSLYSGLFTCMVIDNIDHNSSSSSSKSLLQETSIFFNTKLRKCKTNVSFTLKVEKISNHPYQNHIQLSCQVKLQSQNH